MSVKKYKRVGVVILAGVVAAGCWFGFASCGTPDPVTEAQSFLVDVEHPGHGSIHTSNDLIGTVEAKNSAVVYPQISGEILDVYVEPGDVVSQGQLLCSIDNVGQDSAKVGVDGAMISYQDAKTNLERMTVLYQEGAVSKQAYDGAVSAYQGAKIQLESAEIAYGTQRDFSQVTAPIGGIVENVAVEKHDVATPAMAVCTISGGEEKTVTFSVTDSLVKKIKTNDEVLLEKEGMEYTAVISEVNTIADPMTGLFRIKAEIFSGEGLTNNTTVKVVLTVEETADCLVLPLSVVYYDQGKPYVYVYENERAVRRDILSGNSNEEMMEVVSGVTEEDLVIMTWSSLLHDGAAVHLEAEE